MRADEAFEFVDRSYRGDVGRFYAPGGFLALGKAAIYRDAVFAIYDDGVGIYRTASGVAYVLTHECDVEESNERVFNSDILVCPLVSLVDVVESLQADLNREQLVSFLTNLGSRNISRLIYFPPIPDLFSYGAVLFLNQITNAPVARMRADAHHVCALSGFGLREVDYCLENHLLRPKSDRLAFVPEGTL